jgi:hypothetical protein
VSQLFYELRRQSGALCFAVAGMMARSQDELIEFLLAEIASSGAHGEF